MKALKLIAVFVMLGSIVSCSGFDFGMRKTIGDMTLSRLQVLEIENAQLRAQLQQVAAQMQQTQQIIGQIRFPVQAAQALRQVGWKVQEQIAKPEE